MKPKIKSQNTTKCYLNIIKISHGLHLIFTFLWFLFNKDTNKFNFGYDSKGNYNGIHILTSVRYLVLWGSAIYSLIPWNANTQLTVDPST